MTNGITQAVHKPQPHLRFYCLGSTSVQLSSSIPCQGSINLHRHPRKSTFSSLPSSEAVPQVYLKGASDIQDN
ncbi:uncharacterized protein YALI1_B15301g [Yarrowia lipolytica]|uniref:Uncharacterized protein n=1 Tax=Yarrowia lipolytica TaxID=4952 RepID=A0A1D8N7E5_YARLL|nr:hypothetical protein YALI1_B15301g [Yarrowia lipolytica]